MYWGVFQNEAVITVGGVQSKIVRRYDNSILFYPPNEGLIGVDDDIRVSALKSFCFDKADMHIVEVGEPNVFLSHSLMLYTQVQAGNTVQSVGCLQYYHGKVLLVPMLSAILPVGFILLLVAIGCYLSQKKKTSEARPRASGYLIPLRTLSN
jgi:hypothetical protein